jgi:transcriptional regulator with XRE-family HTH domain
MDAHILENIRAHIEAYKAEQGMTVKALAEHFQLNAVTLWEIRRGRQGRSFNFRLHTLCKLAEGMGITVSELLEEKA